MDTKIAASVWSDAGFLELRASGKLAFFWLLSNERINTCGYGEVSSLKVFRFQTDLADEALDEVFEGLPKGFVRVGKGYWSRNYIGWQLGRGKKLAKNNMARTICKHVERGPVELRALVLAEYPELIEVFQRIEKEGLPKGSPTPTQGEREREREREYTLDRGESARGAEPAGAPIRNSHGGVAADGDTAAIPTEGAGVSGAAGSLDPWPVDLAGVPKSLRTAVFAEVWRDWRQYWSESFANGRPMPQAPEHSQLRALAALGPDLAIEAVRNGIDRGLRKPALSFEREAELRNSHGGAKGAKIPTEGAGAALSRAVGCGNDKWLCALARAEGSDSAAVTESGLRALNTALGEILRAAPDVTPEEIERRGRVYRSVFAGASITAGAIARHWAKLGGGVGPTAKTRADAVAEPEGWREFLRDELPGCVYAPGGDREAEAWGDIDADGQAWIAGEIAQGQARQSAASVAMTSEAIA